MKYEHAQEISELALKAISVLSQILSISQKYCSESDFERMKKAIGYSIGKIQTDVLDIICHEYPELDDLK